MATKIENNDKLLDMVANQRTLKRLHAPALVDKNATTATAKRASVETADREAKLTKDVRAEMKNDNSNEKLAEDKKKKSYDMSRHVQYI